MTTIKQEFRSQQRKRKDSTDDDESNAPLFLRKTYAMLSSCPADIACWSDDGSSIIVKDANRLASEIIPTIFKHNKYSSFVRQLNFYGFRKLRHETNEDHWEFKHPLFRRGDTRSIALIKKSAHFDEGVKKDELIDVKNHLWDLSKRMSDLDQMVDMLSKSLINMNTVGGGTVASSPVYPKSDEVMKKRKHVRETSFSNIVPKAQVAIATTVQVATIPIFQPAVLQQPTGGAVLQRQHSLSDQSAAFELADFDFEDFFSVEAMSAEFENDQTYEGDNNTVTDSNDHLNDMNMDMADDISLYPSLSMTSTYNDSNHPYQPHVASISTIEMSNSNIITNDANDTNFVPLMSKLTTIAEQAAVSTNDISQIINSLPVHWQGRFVDQLAQSFSQKLIVNNKDYNVVNSVNSVLTNNTIDSSTQSVYSPMRASHVSNTAEQMISNKYQQQGSATAATESVIEVPCMECHNHATHTAATTAAVSVITTAAGAGVTEPSHVTSIHIVAHNDHNDFTFTCHCPTPSAAATATAAGVNITSDTTIATTAATDATVPSPFNDVVIHTNKNKTIMVQKDRSSNSMLTTAANTDTDTATATNNNNAAVTAIIPNVCTEVSAANSAVVQLDEASVAAFATMILKCMSSSLVLMNSNHNHNHNHKDKMCKLNSDVNMSNLSGSVNGSCTSKPTSSSSSSTTSAVVPCNCVHCNSINVAAAGVASAVCSIHKCSHPVEFAH